MTTEPTEQALEKAALESAWPPRLIAFTRWVGAGRKLTQTGRVTLADGRMLVQLLDTGDVMDPVTGGEMVRTKSSEELFGLSLVVEWARAAGLVRRSGNQLVAVKKHAVLLDRPLPLWERMFQVVGDLGLVVCPAGWGVSILREDFEVGLRVLLASMDVASGPVDVEAAADQVWSKLVPMYRIETLTDVQLSTWQRLVTRDVWRTVRLMVELAALELDASRAAEDVGDGRPRPGVVVTELGRWALLRRRAGLAPQGRVPQRR